MEVELIVTKRDDDNRQREYRAICLRNAGRQSFAIYGYTAFLLKASFVCQDQALNSLIL